MDNKNILNYTELCVYCFDVLVNHLNKTKLEVEFPNNFKGVHIGFNLIRNPFHYL